MSFLNNMKTKYKLLVSFSLAFIFQFALMTIVTGIFISKGFNKIQINNTETLITNTRDMLSLTIDSTIKNYLRGIAEKNLDIVEEYYDKYLKGELKEKEAYSIVRQIILSQKIGKTGYVAGVNSRGILEIHPVSQGVDASKFDFMKKATAMKEGFLEYNWKNAGETEERSKVGYMTYFKPWDLILWVSSYKDEFVNLVNPDDFQNQLLQIKVGDTGYIFIIDSKGNTIIHPELKNVNILESSGENSVDFLKEIIQNKNGKIKYSWKGVNDKRKREKIIYYKYIFDTDWIVCGGTYVDELNDKVKQVVLLMMIFLFVGIIIFISLSYLIAGFVTKPVNKAVEKIKYIINNNDLSQQLTVYSDDEIGVLTKSFNKFIIGIADILIKVKLGSQKINDLVQSLFSSVQETYSTTNQQAAAVKEIVSTMEDADTLAKTIGNRIVEVTNTTENSRNIVNTGFDKVKESIQKMEEINQSNKSTIEGIQYLNEKINSIWDIVNMINGIADQTKIIAFNAELEASAAGEAGKNFRIVATEIRRLADNTVTSTSEIKEKITDIQKSSDRLLLTSENGTEKIKEGNQLSSRINEMFKDILISAEASSDSTKQISISIKQQISSFEQILVALKQISEGVDNAAAATRETNKVADNLQELVEVLNGILTIYKIKEVNGNIKIK